MPPCTCPRVDGYRIRAKGCPRHHECLDKHLAGFVCTSSDDHAGDHTSPNGSTWINREDPR